MHARPLLRGHSTARPITSANPPRITLNGTPQPTREKRYKSIGSVIRAAVAFRKKAHRTLRANADALAANRSRSGGGMRAELMLKAGHTVPVSSGSAMRTAKGKVRFRPDL